MQLNRFGFYPAGGGEIVAVIKPGNLRGDVTGASPETNTYSPHPNPLPKGEGTGSCNLKPLHLPTRGERVNAYAESYFAALPAHIAERELSVVKAKMAWGDNQLMLKELNRQQGLATCC